MALQMHSSGRRKMLGSTWVGATPFLRNYRVG